MSIDKITLPLEALHQSSIHSHKLLNDTSEELRLLWRRLQDDYMGQGAEEADMQYQVLAQQVLTFQQEIERLMQFCIGELELAKERDRTNAT